MNHDHDYFCLSTDVVDLGDEIYEVLICSETGQLSRTEAEKWSDEV